jgi:DNA polymerase-3 subunit gamma/tau
MSRLERLEQTVAAGAIDAATTAKAVPTDPATGRATIGGRAKRDTAPTAATPGSPTAPSTSSASTSSSTHPSQPSSDKPAPSSTSTATPAATTDNSQIPALFETQVRPALRGMTKAIYMGAHVGSMAGDALVISFAGEPHRARAEEYRHDVERALAAAAGRAITLSLVVDHVGHDDNVVQLKRAEPAQADEDIDTGDLVDVPPDAIVSPIDRLTQAFPGSEIIEERT